ncbi:GFA family protein [Bisgaard Taxon 46]
MDYPINGQCQCGQVHYTLHKAPLVIAACHCKQCQKLSSSAFSISAMIDKDALELTGELKQFVRQSESGHSIIAMFCPICANPIYHYSPSYPDKLMLKPSTLDNTDIIEPTIHVWTKEKQSWYSIPDNVMAFETQP